MATCPNCNSRDTASELPIDGKTVCNECGFQDYTDTFNFHTHVVDISKPVHEVLIDMCSQIKRK